MPSWAAAICGAMAALNKYGFATARGNFTLEARARQSASSLHQIPSRRTAPAATGFMPAARQPRPAKVCKSALEIRVLPTSVSVPVTKQEKGGLTSSVAIQRVEGGHQPSDIR